MWKKYTAIFAMMLAWVILFGHSIIPHDHHDAKELHQHHFLSDQHHNSSDHHNPLTEAFAHFVHNTDGINFIDSKVSVDKTVKQSLLFTTGLSLICFIEKPGETVSHFLSPPDPLFQALLINSSGLRAPPVFIG